MDRNALQASICNSVKFALAEDIGAGDLTANLIPQSATARATVICRQEAIICGRDWFDEVFRQLPEDISVVWHVADGDRVIAGQVLCELAGSAHAILTGERSALNFLQTLSATATLAGHFAAVISGTQAVALDTRKTLPGLRLAQKYAVQCGGCMNHRVGLFDGILIKENHIMAAGSISEVVKQAKEQGAGVPIQVEVEGMDELREAIAAGADMVLLDNFSLALLREAVKFNAGRILLEASGDVKLDTIRAIAETGVDRISVGALTKNVTAVDLSMRFQVDN